MLGMRFSILGPVFGDCDQQLVRGAFCQVVCNEQLRRSVVSLLWVFLGLVCAFWLAVQLLLPQLRRRHGFARKDLRVPKQLFSIYGE